MLAEAAAGDLGGPAGSPVTPTFLFYRWGSIGLLHFLVPEPVFDVTLATHPVSFLRLP